MVVRNFSHCPVLLSIRLYNIVASLLSLNKSCCISLIFVSQISAFRETELKTSFWHVYCFDFGPDKTKTNSTEAQFWSKTQDTYYIKVRMLFSRIHSTPANKRKHVSFSDFQTTKIQVLSDKCTKNTLTWNTRSLFHLIFSARLLDINGESVLLVTA